ncbi:hypothetical protein WJX84_007307 [Apatococcus fuscideae]|uniref:Uncharacterized protein n=1 Tax=Apatococcus fuscideae TaxID=2026836 RepID=A0AAW1RRI3_9CHLO
MAEIARQRPSSRGQLRCGRLGAGHASSAPGQAHHDHQAGSSWDPKGLPQEHTVPPPRNDTSATQAVSERDMEVGSPSSSSDWSLSGLTDLPGNSRQRPPASVTG